MDTKLIGKFIQERRKEKHLTQLQLSIKLGVSEKTISKWECGNGLPDASLMLPLCRVLGISANELLSGKLLSEKKYKTKSEENLLILKASNERNIKHLFAIEWVLGLMSTFVYLTLIFCSVFATENFAWRITIIVIAIVILLVGVCFALRIEQVAGFYECQHCHYKYIPKYSEVFFSPHSFRTRYMKCPKCHKRSWQRKSIVDDLNSLD